MTWSNAVLLRTVAFLLLVLGIPGLARAAGWVLIAPPHDEKGIYFRNIPVNGSWRQLAAFDTAAQCEAQRMVEIRFWQDRVSHAPDADSKKWAEPRLYQEYLIRCMPFDLWWKAQQSGSR
jgi:hypothetical protein